MADSETSSPAAPAPRRYSALSVRLSASLVTVVLLAIGIGFVVDYTREHHVHHSDVLTSLEQESRTLRLARVQIGDDAEFALFVDQFCASVDAKEAPGHFVLVTDSRGQVIIRAGHSYDAQTEQTLLNADSPQGTLSVGDSTVAYYRLPDDGSTILVGHHLDEVEEILHTQLVSRAVTAAATALAIVIFIALAMRRWVLSPVRSLSRAAGDWAARKFSTRVEVTGPEDFRLAFTQFNNMALELQREENHRTAALERARSIQEGLLPRAMPQVRGLKLAAAYRPVEHVAGDLYDAFALSGDRAAVAIFDVAGHGISASLLTGIVKMALHYHLESGLELAEAVRHVNRDMINCAPDYEFITACIGLWDNRLNRWTYCAAGHPGGLLMERQEAVRSLPVGGLPLGIDADATWQTFTVDLKPGDRLFLYTDGVTDAGLPQAALGEAGMTELIRAADDQPLATAVSNIMGEVERRTDGRPFDDCTVLAFEVA